MMSPRGVALVRDENPHRDRERIVDWARLLPREWKQAAVVPLSFEFHREYEMAARRIVGRDEDGAPCYCSHAYLLTDLESADGEEFHEVLAYGEAVAAWRLRDGRWLIHRIVAGRDSARAGRGFYGFSETMPR